MTAKLTKAIDGVYTRMLRVLHQVCWRDHFTNVVLYRNLPKLSTKIQRMRMKFASHCYRNSELVASQLVLWQPIHGRKNRGRQLTAYVDILLKDTKIKIINEGVNSMGEWMCGKPCQPEEVSGCW